MKRGVTRLGKSRLQRVKTKFIELLDYLFADSIVMLYSIEDY